MEPLTLPLAPGSATAILHPFNVFGASWAIVRHALSSLNPDTAIVRRTHRTRSRAAASEGHGGDTASVASSRGSRRSNALSAEAADTHVSGAHRRHRTHSGDKEGARRHRHRTSSQESESAEAAAASPPSTSARRTRSAEEPLAAARRSASERDAKATGEDAPLPRVRRSHSDGVRGRTRRQDSESGGGGSGATTPRLSASHSLSSAATAAAASGLTPPLAPPPPVSRGLGKPPLSSRQRSTSSMAADGEPTAPSRHRHRRSGSGGGLSSSGRSSRTHRSVDDAESNEGSVIVIRDGTGIGLGGVSVGWPSFSAWSPRAWWDQLRKVKVTRSALLLNHVLHAVPVMVVHYCCELKRQLVTLPLLRFSDMRVTFSPRGPHGASESGHVLHHATTAPAASSTHHDTTVTAEWPPSEEAFEKSAPSTVGHLLLTRWMLQALESYIEKLFFLDETLVVRQLRSKRTLRRVVGWSLRLVSHTIFDPFLLSIVVPMLVAATSAAEPTAVPRVLFTAPGMARGLGISAASVVVQWLVMPVASRLVYRATLTIFEVAEYLITRRYAHWSDEDDDDEDDEEEGEGGDADDGASLASGVSGAGAESRGASRSASQQSSASAAATAEDRIQRERRRLRREKRERRARREQRQAARDQAMRRTVLRAIVYRVVSSVVAQAVVDHPLSVLVELLRGRATLHLTGLLAPYAAMTAEQDGLSWSHVWRYAAALASPGSNVSGGSAGDQEDGEGVPPALLVLRRVGQDVARELVVLTSSVLDNSGQRAPLAAVQQRAAAKTARGEVTSAADSAEFLAHSALSLSPFYYGLQFTVLDKVLTFYLAVWTRLTKQ